MFNIEVPGDGKVGPGVTKNSAEYSSLSLTSSNFPMVPLLWPQVHLLLLSRQNKTLLRNPSESMGFAFDGLFSCWVKACFIVNDRP